MGLQYHLCLVDGAGLLVDDLAPLDGSGMGGSEGCLVTASPNFAAWVVGRVIESADLLRDSGPEVFEGGELPEDSKHLVKVVMKVRDYVNDHVDV